MQRNKQTKKQKSFVEIQTRNTRDKIESGMVEFSKPGKSKSMKTKSGNSNAKKSKSAIPIGLFSQYLAVS